MPQLILLLSNDNSDVTGTFSYRTYPSSGPGPEPAHAASVVGKNPDDFQSGGVHLVIILGIGGG
jgi:hypothetical protein